MDVLNTIILIIGFFTETTLGVFLFRAAVAFAVTAAARAIFAPDYKAPRIGLQDRTVTVRDTLASRKIIYGQARVGGVIVYIETTDSNRYLHLLVAYACHECESFDAHYFDEHQLTLSGNDVTAPSHLAGKVKVYEHLGADSQAADANLVGASALWTTSHRLRGIAYAYYRLEFDSTAFAAGIPNITALISGKKVYDPRTATTVWSANAALCAADYLMDSRYGLGVPLSSIDTTVLTTAANTCDDAVALLAGGTEDRYTCNGVVDLASTPREIIEQLATAKAAPTAYFMGMWYVQAGEYRTPALSFDEDDMAGPLQIQTRYQRADLFNHVKGTYASPVNDWQPADFPVVTSSTYLAEDNNEVIWREMQLTFTTSAATAQRIALLELNRARRQITVTARFKMMALDVIPTDVIQLSNARLGWSSKTFEVQDWRFVPGDDMSLSIEMVLRETDSAVYSWSTADESAANATPTTNLPDFRTIAAPTAFGVSSVQVPTGSGSDETYAVLLQWTAPSDYFVVNGGLIEVQWKKSADSTWLPSFFVNGGQEEQTITMLEVGTAYDFRIRSYNYIAYSNWQTVTGITILASGGVGTSQDWGDWISTPGACGASPSCDWGDWISSPSATDDWGSWT